MTRYASESTLEKENLMFLSKGYRGCYNLYFTHPISGKRTKVTTGTTSYKMAERFMERFSIEDYLSPKAIEKSQQVRNLEQLREVVLDYARTNFMPKTVELYNLTFRALIKIIGNKPLFLIKLSDFERLKMERAKEVSRTTVNMAVRTIKSIFNLAVKFGYLDTNPALSLRQLSIPEKEKLCFSDEDLKCLIKAIDKPVLRDIVIFTLYTGCRLAEVTNLQRKDIDFDRSLITIRNKPNFKTKTGKVRIIPISENLQQFLGNFINLSSESYLFGKPNGYRFNPTHISRKFKHFVRKTGLPEKFHFHCLRHTFITKLIRNGVSINYVKELAGHSDIQTTMGYIHIEVEDMRNAMNTLKIAV